MNSENNNNMNVVNTNTIKVVNTQNSEEMVRLNQERENIVNASVVANANIDEKQAKDVNQTIKLKKKNPIVSLIFLFIVVIILIIAILFILKPLKKYLYDLTSTTRPTYQTTVKYSYINDFNILRKFKNENVYLLLSPSNVDEKNNQLYYVLYDLQTDQYKYNTYKINDNELILDDYKTFIINDNKLIDGDDVLTSNVSEIKQYTYRDNNRTLTLLMNGTLKKEVALYIDSSNNNLDVKIGKYIENEKEIKLNNIIFVKENDGVKLNTYLLRAS